MQRQALALLVLWAVLAALAEFAATAPLAVALAWAIAITGTYVYGPDAARELQNMLAGNKGVNA